MKQLEACQELSQLWTTRNSCCSQLRTELNALEIKSQETLHDERIIAVREEPILRVEPCGLSRHVERFIVEKCPMRYESIRRHLLFMVTSIEQSEVGRGFPFSVTSRQSMELERTQIASTKRQRT